MSVSQVIPASLATLNRGSHVSGDTCHMMPFCTARRAAIEGPHRAGVDPVRPAVQPGGSGGPLPSGCRGPAPTPMGTALPSGGIRPDGSDGFGRPGPDAPRSSLLPESQLCAARGVGAASRQRRPLGRRNRNVPAPLAPAGHPATPAEPGRPPGRTTGTRGARARASPGLGGPSSTAQTWLDGPAAPPPGPPAADRPTGGRTAACRGRRRAPSPLVGIRCMNGAVTPVCDWFRRSAPPADALG